MKRKKQFAPRENELFRYFSIKAANYLCIPQAKKKVARKVEEVRLLDIIVE